jgi:hypothetical protein
MRWHLGAAPTRPTGTRLISAREVAIPVEDFEAGALPALSVRSGRPASASVAVVVRPRLFGRRQTFWSIWGWTGDVGCLVLLLGLPVAFLLHPYERWLARLLPQEWRAGGRLPLTAGEATRRRWVTNAAYAAAALFAASLVLGSFGAPGHDTGPLGFSALLAATVLGGVDYFSLPTGSLTMVDGLGFVVLRGVHPDFAAAVTRVDSGDPSASELELHLRKHDGRGVGVMTLLFVGVPFLFMLISTAQSHGLERAWTAGGPCTVQVSDHHMTATADGAGALAVCRRWLSQGDAASPSGGPVCSYTESGLTIEVRDSGGMVYGTNLCNALANWSGGASNVPDLNQGDDWVIAPPPDSPSASAP